MPTRMTRPFYIIGHNPNTVEDAAEYIEAGCNAIEPDIQWDDHWNGSGEKTYYVSEDEFYPHQPQVNPHDQAHSLEVYLQRLARYLSMPDKTGLLSLIVFDVKDPFFSLQDFISFVQLHFLSVEACKDVAILVTIPYLENAQFLNGCALPPNWGVGIDAEGSPRSVRSAIQTGHAGQTAYADGFTIIGQYTDFYPFRVYKSLSQAKSMQILSSGECFPCIYTWVVGNEGDMKRYLGLCISGMIVGLDAGHNGPAMLKDLVSRRPYRDLYRLAAYGDNPFGTAPIPGYSLEVVTANNYWSGTDSLLKFTLNGSQGKLYATVDCNYQGMMESGATDYVNFEGSDIGDIRSLTIESAGTRFFPEWEPLTAVLRSPLLRHDLPFKVPANTVITKDNPSTLVP